MELQAQVVEVEERLILHLQVEVPVLVDLVS
jgi:hypothetical protein